MVCYLKWLFKTQLYKNDLVTTNTRTAQINCIIYLFEKRVSPDFLCSDLACIKLSHILAHHRLHIHGSIQTTLQFPEQRHQGPRQETCLLSTAWRSMHVIKDVWRYLNSFKSGLLMNIRESKKSYPEWCKSFQNWWLHKYTRVCFLLEARPSPSPSWLVRRTSAVWSPVQKSMKDRWCQYIEIKTFRERLTARFCHHLQCQSTELLLSCPPSRSVTMLFLV